MERKKLVLLIAAAVVAVLFLLVLFLSSLRQSGAIPEPTPTATTTATDAPAVTDPGTTFIDEPNRDGMLVNPEGDPNGPPSEAYLNDYTEDDGYELLPENYNGEAAPEGTVYDPDWMLLKYYDLECELSTKRTVTERALQPMVNFTADLGLVTSRNAGAPDLRSAMNETLERYQKYMNQRAPEEQRLLLENSCDIEHNQPGHLHEDGEEDHAHENIPDIPDYNPADWVGTGPNLETPAPTGDVQGEEAGQ